MKVGVAVGMSSGTVILVGLIAGAVWAWSKKGKG
jgi:hypothetical protein